MKLITERDLIRGIADAWGHPHKEANGDNYRTWVALDSLNKETASADEVSKIIGNDSWTRINCDECGKRVLLVVQVGLEPDYDVSNANLCATCLTAAYALLPHNEE